MPTAIDIPLRPLKGQALALRTTRETGSLSHVVWTEQIHLAPKSDGRLIVGATMEDAGFNPAITAGGVLALLEGVHRALPSSEEMEIEAIWSGFRPTTEDDAPILGDTGVPGLLVATGHHRNGILLAPVTAAAIEELVTDGRHDRRRARCSGSTAFKAHRTEHGRGCRSTTMILTVNGEPRESASANLAELWREETEDLNLDSPKGYAIALNGALVRKDKWQSTTLGDGDRVEIVRAMQGG